MRNFVKIYIGIFVAILFVAIIFTKSVPKSDSSIFDGLEKSQYLIALNADLNADLPREIGTIGYLDSVICSEKTFTYIMSVRGDSRIKQVYTENYNDFKDLLKYSIITMNGQNDLGNKLSELLDKQGIDLEIKIYTPDKDFTKWSISSNELADFVKSCKLDPTQAFHKIIEMQIKIANLDLPMKPNDASNIESVTLNSIVSYDENMLLQSIDYIEDSIIFEYKVNEKEYDLNQLKQDFQNEEYINEVTKEFSLDVDFKEFMNLVSISHSNLVIKCIGKSTNKKVELRIPYSILKKHSEIPYFLIP